jgi:hypothetical protein
MPITAKKFSSGKPIVTRCLMLTNGMLLKHIFGGCEINQKAPPFLYNNLLNGFTKNTRWWLNKIFKKGPAGHVPDRRSRNIPEVVLVRRWAVRVLGIWRGKGLGEGWDKGGQFTSNLRPRWTIPVTARRVPSK